MGERGRKSAASLSVVGGSREVPVGKRLAPGPGLSAAEKKIWKRIVESKPADWFTEGDAPLLADYCRHIARQESLSRQINRMTAKQIGTKTGMSKYRILLGLSEGESRIIASLATKMRLSQQARYTTKSAGTAANKGAGRNPWES